MDLLKKKEQPNKDIFYNICKDLMRYIDKKIINKYISPNEAQIPKEKRMQGKKYNDNKWRYFYMEEATEEDIILDIFKDNNFLNNLQKLYNQLKVIINDMDKNKQNIEILKKKKIEEDEKYKTLNEISNKVAQYIIEKNNNKGAIQKDELIQAFNNLKNNNVIKNISQDMLEKCLNTFQKNNIFINENNNNNQINESISNKINTFKTQENKKNTINKSSNKNSSIANLIQALKNINKKEKNLKKDKECNDIFESNSSNDECSEENEEEEEEANEEEEEGKIVKKIDNKTKKEFNFEKFLNKKTKRKDINK